jgi:hypothetical protein
MVPGTLVFLAAVLALAAGPSAGQDCPACPATLSPPLQPVRDASVQGLLDKFRFYRPSGKDVPSFVKNNPGFITMQSVGEISVALASYSSSSTETAVG